MTWRIAHLVLGLFLTFFSFHAFAASSDDKNCGKRSGHISNIIADSDLKRDLSCETYASNPRAKQICCGLEREQRWEWFGGHGMLSPGWSPNYDSVKTVYCREKVRPVDAEALMLLYASDRASVQFGSEMLLRLLGKSALPYIPTEIYIRETIMRDTTDVISSFNVTNPNYFLKNGCR